MKLFHRYPPYDLEVDCEGGYFISRYNMGTETKDLTGIIAGTDEVDRAALIRWLDDHGVAHTF